MKLLIFLTILVGLANAGDYKMVKKMMEKIGTHKLWSSCFGGKTMLKFYIATKEAQEQCMQLSPVFDIELFDESSEENMIDDDFEDDSGPFVTGQFGGNQGFQTLPAQVPFGGNRLGRPQAPPAGVNPWEAFMAFWAPYYAQQQGRGFRSANPMAFRNKRAVEELSDEDLREFAGDVAEFKEGMKDNIGNLTCVLAKLGALDSNLEVRLDHWTKDIWNEIERDDKQPDPEFKGKLIQKYKDCYLYASKIPKSVLARKGPLGSQFGRQMKFMKCAKKMEKKMCVAQELNRWLELWYGKPEPGLRSKLGLPEDKFMSAGLTFKVLEENKAPAEKFVSEFIFE